MRQDSPSVHEGIPTVSAYDALCSSPLFGRLEQFSGSFLKCNKSNLLGYRQKWVRDPLHQWSRQWEYPFTFRQIENYLQKTGTPNPMIVDAGSGVTFFPFYVAKEFPQSRVVCLDSDESLGPVFSSIQAGPVEFRKSDIRRIAADDSSCEIVYCISVLEHMDDPAASFEEFCRILKPGGLLILTFDISLSSDSATINKSNAKRLLETAQNHFEVVNGNDPLLLLEESLADENILTTHYIARRDTDLLPWKISRARKLRGLVQPGFVSMAISNLTCFCLAMTRPGPKMAAISQE
jgi:SAM-dependent methyltransferase